MRVICADPHAAKSSRGSVFMRTCKVFSAALLLLSFSVLVASQIRADEINYSYTSGSNTFTWTLPTNPVIAPVDAHAPNGFTIPNWSFSENGAPMVGTFDFFSTLNDFGGGFDLKSGSTFFINAMGDQLYSGPESAPTMLTGSFATVDFGSDTSGSKPPTPVMLAPSPVPEPSTLSLWAIGMALALAVTFVRKRLI
jgi:hypothetical protein